MSVDWDENNSPVQQNTEIRIWDWESAGNGVFQGKNCVIVLFVLLSMSACRFIQVDNKKLN